MKYQDYYCNYIIKPLENLKKEIVEKYMKSIFFKKYYKNLLDNIDKELLEKYQKFYEISALDYKD